MGYFVVTFACHCTDRALVLFSLQYVYMCAVFCENETVT
uniref:Uncharacterized protein n=1 Tax=Anguilla anguilla TaxID=7936 RepID=A0A0E9VNK6_ANGAN